VAWLTGWTYRKSITLSRASGAVTNYQMKLLVGESAGATGEDVDCNGHVQTDFDDLRFTTSDGQTLLDYWIESITGTTPNQLATVWIEFDSIGTGATTFYMYYGWGTVGDPSTVGVNWGRSVNNPVLAVGSAGQWDDGWVAIHSIWNEGGTYYAYYNGRRSSTQMQVGLATSTDCVNWSKSGSNPVLAFGTAGQWDDYVVGSPLVWKEGATWYMLYNGAGDASGSVGIGLATSSDGISWTRSGSNPVITQTQAWELGGGAAALLSPGTNIIKEGSTYYLYYSAGSRASQTTWAIGLAWSTDLISWTKSGSNPVFSKSGVEAFVCEPFVKLFGSTYYMWYQRGDGGIEYTNIGLATSTDKTTWSTYGSNPVLNYGTGCEWDGVWAEVPVLIQVGSYWRLYYSGSVEGSYFIQTGYATAHFPGGPSGTKTFLLFDHFNGGDIRATLGAVWSINGSPSCAGTSLTLDAASEGIKSIATYQYKRFRASINFPANANASYRNWAGFKNVFDQETAETAHVVPVGGATTNMYRQTYKTNWESVNDGGGFTDAYVIFQIDRNASWVKFYYNNVLKGTHSTQVPTISLSAWFMAAITGNYFSPFYVDWMFVANLEDPEPAWGSWGEEEIPTVEIQGNVALSLSPGSTSISEYVCQGAVSISLTPQAAIIADYILVGTVLLNLLPNSVYFQTIFVVQGNITVSLTPQSIFVADYLFQGELSLSLTPGAMIIVEIVYLVMGQLLIQLLLSSQIEIGLLDYSYETLAEKTFPSQDGIYESEIDGEKSFLPPDGVYPFKPEMLN